MKRNVMMQVERKKEEKYMKNEMKGEKVSNKKYKCELLSKKKIERTK